MVTAFLSVVAVREPDPVEYVDIECQPAAISVDCNNVQLTPLKLKALHRSGAMANSDLVINTTQKMDMISKQLYIQSRSFDDVVEMCKNHDEMLRCIPAIQPVSNKDLRKTASGYGTRIDPIYGTSKFHEGMDFSAPQGTDVYATGDGTVVQMGWQSGYGNRIVIDHGFGYQTVYAHLRDFRTKLGKKVVRGEVIGGVGSTGKSTGPHLHYEVHVKGKVVNPVNYYFMDLSAEDYDRMIQIAANHGKVLD